MKIGIIGAGNVGGALGRAWAASGHEVRFGVRDSQHEKVVKLLSDAGPAATAGTTAEAVAHSDVVVLATPWGATQDALADAGDLSGKVLLDATNPLAPGDITTLDVGHTASGAEMVASWAPGARVVKIFNNTGAANMANPRYTEGPVTMFYCGDDAEAKDVASRLASDIGFTPVDAGALAMARTLEPLALLWINLAYSQGLGPQIAFQLMRR